MEGRNWVEAIGRKQRGGRNGDEGTGRMERGRRIGEQGMGEATERKQRVGRN